MAGDIQITFDAVLGGTAKADISKLRDELNKLDNKTFNIKLKDNSETIIRHLTKINTLAKQLEKGFDIKVSSKSPISKYFKSIQNDVNQTVQSLSRIGETLSQINGKNLGLNLSLGDAGKEATGRYIENVREYVRGLKQAREMIAKAASNKDINQVLNTNNKQQLRDFMFSGAEFDKAIESFESKLNRVTTRAGAERVAKDALQYWNRLTPLMETIQKSGLFDMGGKKLGAFPSFPKENASEAQALAQVLSGINLQIQEASINSGNVSGNFNQVAASAETAGAAIQEVAAATETAAKASEKMASSQQKTTKKKTSTASGKTESQLVKEQEDQMWQSYRAEKQLEEQRIADTNRAYAERASVRAKEASEQREADRKAIAEYEKNEAKKEAAQAKIYEDQYLARRRAAEKQMSDAEKDYNKTWKAAEASREKDISSRIKAAEQSIKTYEKGYQRLKSGSFGDTKEVSDLSNQINKVRELTNAAKDIKLYDPDATQKLNKLSSAVSSLGTNYEKVSAKAKAFSDAQKLATKESAAFERQSKSMQSKMQGFLDKNSRVAGTSYEARIQDLMADMDARVANKTGTKADLKSYEDQFNKIKSAAADAGKVGNTLGQSIAHAVKQFGGWMLVTHSIMSVINTIKGMITNVRDLDREMTELKKVTNETDTAYEEFFDRAKVRAKETGATLTDTIRASADMARLGLSIPEAETMADAATIYKNVGDGLESIDEASQSIISTVKAFGMSANDAMTVVDKYNEVGNNFAISSAGVGEAMTRSASAMAAAGNTLDETIALIAAGNEVVQDPQKMGEQLRPAA